MNTLGPAAPSDHYLSLVGASLIPTLATRTTAKKLNTVITAQAMMCVHGGVGLGKTLAVKVNLRDLAPDNTLWFEFREGTTAHQTRTALVRALDLPTDTTAETDDLDDLIKASLADQPRVFVFDEAQGLSTQALAYVRHLWDNKHTQLAVIFVGGENCHQKMRGRAALASRICIWQQYSPLRPKEILGTMPNYHPVWADVSPKDLLWVDDLSCHGNFRNWAKVTFHLQNALQDPETTHTSFSRNLMREVLSELDSFDRSQHTDSDDVGYM
ncbi:AAA family ATPase [Streptomyces sp. NPDC001820]|uniref:AAA family ATPase n=1 Tax=Streptomyces sp. NPDC001820 TaxID=3364613 RepID=UPI0036870E4A